MTRIAGLIFLGSKIVSTECAAVSNIAAVFDQYKTVWWSKCAGRQQILADHEEDGYFDVPEGHDVSFLENIIEKLRDEELKPFCKEVGDYLVGQKSNLNLEWLKEETERFEKGITIMDTHVPCLRGKCDTRLVIAVEEMDTETKKAIYKQLNKYCTKRSDCPPELFERQQESHIQPHSR